MQKWEYQTIVARIGRDRFIEIMHINGNDARLADPHGTHSEPVFPDLPAFLAELGLEGWEVTGVTPMTSSVPTTGLLGEGRLKVMIILKRPLA